MRYENEKCSFCGELFQQDDKIVVCPECGAPHHKNCYEITSKCAFDNLHTEGFVWSPSIETKETESHTTAASRETKVCPVCQSENDILADVCSNCNAPFLVSAKQTDSQRINIDGEYISTNEYIDRENTVTVGEASVYIKTNSEKFIKGFLKAKYTKSNQKFNFAAFFLSAYWFFYRKMYLQGILFAGAGIAGALFFMSLISRCFPEAMAYLSSAAGQTNSNVTEIFEKYQEYMLSGIKQHPALYRAICFFPLIFLAIQLVAGFSANSIYLKKIKKDVQKIKAISPNKDTLYAYLYAKGGTSILMVVVAFFLIDWLTQILFML